MDSTSGEKDILYFGSAARGTAVHKPGAPNTGAQRPGEQETGAALREQLENALQRLVRSVNTLVYTRNPVALSVTAQQCDQVEQLLDKLRLLHPGQRAGDAQRYVQTLEALLYTEAEGLLAEARRLVSVPLKPVRRDDNVVVLKPDYADLADAAFERMLASSDIPQLLNDDLCSESAQGWDEEMDFEAPARPAVTPPVLKLVYSSDSPRRS